MENKKYLLGFDMGTSGLKCVALDPVSGERHSVYSEWTLLTPQQGYAEFDCDELWYHIVKCIRALKTEHGLDLSLIRAIGFCALCPGLVALAEDGRELSRCIIFMDARSGEENAFIQERIPFEQSFPIISNRIMSGATSITSILWIKNHMPEVYEKTKYFVHLPSWAGYKLTGKVRMDLSNAAGTGLYNVHKQQWSATMADAAGIDIEKMPSLAGATEPLSTVVNQELLELGIKPDTIVSCGAGDTVCALLALGIEEGTAMLSLGTSHVLYAVCNQDRFNPALMARSYVYRDTWAEGGAMSNPGAMLRWFRDGFCKDLSALGKSCGKSAYQLIDEEAATVEPGSGGVICLPYINGERSPVYDSSARAVFSGVNLNTERGHISRAIMEGAGYGIRQILELLDQGHDEPIKEVHVVGGGSKSDFLVQIMADITGRRLVVRDLPDAGALGAAMTAAMAAGILAPGDKLPIEVSRKEFIANEENKAVYDSAYKKYLQLYPSMKHLF